MWWSYRPYVSVAKRKANAQREMKKLAKKGQTISPVQMAGRKIATTFWGNAWCDHLESYSDYSNRLPRGRTYVRNGSVVDLQIEPGKVTAFVSGSELYEITIAIKPLAKSCWGKIRGECGGQIGSLVELLQGKLSNGVMEIVTRRPGGLFPTPGEIEMRCSCPDYAGMCKHLAAALYGVGNRLDQKPELLFTLRKVDHLELIAQAGEPLTAPKLAASATLADEQLADVFGIELASPASVTTAPPAGPQPARPRRKKLQADENSAPPPGHTPAKPARSISEARPSGRSAKGRKSAKSLADKVGSRANSTARPGKKGVSTRSRSA